MDYAVPRVSSSLSRDATISPLLAQRRKPLNKFSSFNIAMGSNKYNFIPL